MIIFMYVHIYIYIYYVGELQCPHCDVTMNDG